MTLVHITLKESARDDAAAKQKVRRLVAELGMTQINQKRFDRYGILSGQIDSSALPRIAQLAEVEAVEQDRERHTL